MPENHPEAYQPPKATSLRHLRGEERRLQRDRTLREDAHRANAVGQVLSALVNTDIAPFTFEAITPVTAFRRLSSRKKDQMIPASTWQTRKKLLEGMSAPAMYTKYLGDYLKVERVDGYYIKSASPEGHAGYKEAILMDGRVGKIIKPADNPRTYTTSGPGYETVELARMDDRFSNRNCDAVWAPSLVHVSKLYTFEIESYAEALGFLPSTDH